MKTKTVLFLILAAIWVFLADSVFSGISTLARQYVAVDTVQSSDAAWIRQQALEESSRLPWVSGPIAVLFVALFWRELLRGLKAAFKMTKKHNSKAAAALMLSFMVLTLGGCVKPYNAPVFADIGSNETAYVIPLQGDTGAQGKFASAEFLQQHKVALKRIQVPRQWVSNGYLYNSGFYQDQVRVIQVNRTPVTREFHQDTAGKKDADAIWIESRDSVGFSTGFSVTAMIREEDTSTFLYRYNTLGLGQVMDSEVRARIQKIAANFAAQFILDELRAKKNDMLSAINADVVPFFAERGITITTIGQFGGMTYENPEIQKSIDNTFVAQQAKVVAAALLTAQADVNKKSQEIAEQAKANAILVAEGEARAISLVADAAQKAQSSPSFIRLKELEVEVKKLDKWNGITPTTLISGRDTGLSMFMPPPVASK